jgi:hypothetical protein
MSLRMQPCSAENISSLNSLVSVGDVKIPIFNVLILFCKEINKLLVLFVPIRNYRQVAVELYFYSRCHTTSYS